MHMHLLHFQCKPPLFNQNVHFQKVIWFNEQFIFVELNSWTVERSRLEPDIVAASTASQHPNTP